ncbi:acyl-CoA thioesterase [Geothrix fuzhouensis]|uniref:acyl-CoA thioesterase n=1 Tax=Geothrix fuzhouensis TaxID=2966451 RepID=UPI00214766AB|nr:thioesterase family protein [Geothrix fuzhouensis]
MTFLQTSVTLEIPFHDVDSMGIVWHGHYLKYFEIARTALMRRAGLDVADMLATGCAWPVVTCEVKYIRPLRYGQRILVEAYLEEYEFRIGIAYTVRDETTGERLTRGRTRQLPIDSATGELCPGTPPGMIAAIERALG